MALQLANLDQQTRQHMLAEFEGDIEAGTLYVLPRLSRRGHEEWPTLLLSALTSGNDTTLAARLWGPGGVNASEQKHKPSGD